MSGGCPRAPAPRLAGIEPFRVMALLARARALEAAGRDIVHMEIGEPDFPPPAPVVRAAQAALAAGETRYTPAGGLPALREAIARWYRERFGVAVPAERILVTPGASGALHLVLAALAGPGDRVLLPAPGYPCNRHLARLVGAEPVALPAEGPEGGPRPQDVRAAGPAAAVLAATPANPTGGVLGRGALAALADAAREAGACLVCDEIYQGLVYEGEPCTVLEVAAGAFVINSFSKYFGMTGWRLGWVVAPEGWVEALERLAQNLYLAAPTLSQHAALAAFEDESLAELERRRDAFRARRDFLVPALESLRLRPVAPPAGAFYLYADCSAFTEDAETLAARLLEEAGVAVTPGADFGGTGAAVRLRFAYTTSLERLREGVARLRAFLRRA